MARYELPDFKIDKENSEDGIKELILIIKPYWKHDNVTIKLLSGGLSSRMFRCFANDDESDQITVRIRDLMEEFTESPGGVEIEALEYLSTHGHFPTLHAVFANGYCYEYIEGKPLFNLELRTTYMNDEILRSIAEEMAFVNSVKLPRTEYKEVTYFRNMKTLTRKLARTLGSETTPSEDSILKEYDLVEAFVNGLNLPLTLCHGDIHCGNCVWNDTEKKVTFVDWEVAFVGYLFFDVAFFLGGIRRPDDPDDPEKKYLRYYFDAWSEKNKDNAKTICFQEFVSNVEKLQLMCSLVTLTFATLVPSEGEILFGPGNSFNDDSIRDYLKLKKKFLGYGEFET